MLDGFTEGQCVWGRVWLLLSPLWVPTLSSSTQCLGKGVGADPLAFCIRARKNCVQLQKADGPNSSPPFEYWWVGIVVKLIFPESGAAYLVLLQVCELNWRLKWPHTASLCGCPSCQHGNQLWFSPTVWRFPCVLDAENMLSSSLKGLQSSLPLLFLSSFYFLSFSVENVSFSSW